MKLRTVYPLLETTPYDSWSRGRRRYEQIAIPAETNEFEIKETNQMAFVELDVVGSRKEFGRVASTTPAMNIASSGRVQANAAFTKLLNKAPHLRVLGDDTDKSVLYLIPSQAVSKSTVDVAYGKDADGEAAFSISTVLKKYTSYEYWIGGQSFEVTEVAKKPKGVEQLFMVSLNKQPVAKPKRERKSKVNGSIPATVPAVAVADFASQPI